MSIFNNFGKREALVYLVVFLWVSIGVFAAYKSADFSELAVYFGSLTAYAATYIWAETKRPSKKTGIFRKGPRSRREIMIYVVVALWAITGVSAIAYMADLSDLAMYFASLTGFVAAWIAGERYRSEDEVKENIEE